MDIESDNEENDDFENIKQLSISEKNLIEAEQKIYKLEQENSELKKENASLKQSNKNLTLRAMESRRLRPVVRSRRRFLADRFAGTAKAPDFSLIP